MQAAVIVFPGSNCDQDMAYAIEKASGKKPLMVWHGDKELPKNIDFIAIPGGFSYGDYLRCGAMAAKSPIMREIKKAADGGKYILGVCNGFQVLTETGILPGVLMRNKNLNFICKPVSLKIENSKTAYSKAYQKDQILSIPVAHHDGNYFADRQTIEELKANEQIAFRYCNEEGSIDERSNPNGSQENIAGIYSKNHRILGMMPHPERAVDSLTSGGTDGKTLFDTLVKAII